MATRAICATARRRPHSPRSCFTASCVPDVDEPMADVRATAREAAAAGPGCAVRGGAARDPAADRALEDGRPSTSHATCSASSGRCARCSPPSGRRCAGCRARAAKFAMMQAVARARAPSLCRGDAARPRAREPARDARVPAHASARPRPRAVLLPVPRQSASRDQFRRGVPRHDRRGERASARRRQARARAQRRRRDPRAQPSVRHRRAEPGRRADHRPAARGARARRHPRAGPHRGRRRRLRVVRRARCSV